jgi:hypothetical protein
VRRLRGEDGFVGGFEALPFGFLVFVAGSLLLVNAWAVFDCHLAASAAAREAVRAFVESNGTDDDARRAANAAAEEALRGHGKDAARMTIAWDGDALVRCQPVTATVSYRVPTIAVPWLGAFGGSVLTTSARHSEVVDPFRSGLATDGFEPEACGA